MTLNRRQWLQWAGLWAAGAGVSVLPDRVRSAVPANAADLRKALEACTPPSDPLETVLYGNRLFAAAWQKAAKASSPAQTAQALATLWTNNCQVDPHALAKGQKPWLAVLTCADSRIPMEWILASGSGEIFQVRAAGNTAFDDAIASLEYAVSVLGVTLVLVMGHSGCGAVKAAMGSEPLTPLLENLVKPIRASLVPGDDLSKAIEGNARYATAQLTARSTVLSDAVKAGKLVIRSTYFDVGSGLISLV